MMMPIVSGRPRTAGQAFGETSSCHAEAEADAVTSGSSYRLWSVPLSIVRSFLDTLASLRPKLDSVFVDNFELQSKLRIHQDCCFLLSQQCQS